MKKTTFQKPPKPSSSRGGVVDADMAWAGLPERCLITILRHIPCILDHAMFSAVCRRWRSIAQQNPPLNLPWLLMPSTAATSFFCVACGDTHHRPRFPDEARGAFICGSFPGGWLAAVHPSDDVAPHRRPALLNLLTGAHIALPAYRRVDSRPIDVLAVSLSAAPSDLYPYYAAAILSGGSGDSNIAFWTPRMSYWITPPVRKWNETAQEWQKLLPLGSIEDVTYYFGKVRGFYVLNNTEDLVVYVPATDANGVLTFLAAIFEVGDECVTMPGPGHLLSRYLVQSRGELLMVVRYVSPENYMTMWFEVFKLEDAEAELITQPSSSGLNARVHRASWTQLPSSSLSGRKIFLGRCCSIAVDVRYPCPPDIYFLDDAVAVRTSAPFPCADTGRCLLFDQDDEDIVSCFPTGPPSDCSPWTWFFLSGETFHLLPHESKRQRDVGSNSADDTEAVSLQ